MIRDQSHHDVKESIILSGQRFIGSFDDQSRLGSLFLILVIPKERTLIEHDEPADDRKVGKEKKSERNRAFLCKLYQ